MANATHGKSSAHPAAMYQRCSTRWARGSSQSSTPTETKLIEAEYGSWLEGLVDNEVLVLPGGNAATVDAVVRGEVLLGCTDIDDVDSTASRFTQCRCRWNG